MRALLTENITPGTTGTCTEPHLHAHPPCHSSQADDCIACVKTCPGSLAMGCTRGLCTHNRCEEAELRAGAFLENHAGL